MVPDATPTVDEEFIWLKREDFSLWNIKVYNQTHTHFEYKRYTSVQDLANGNLFFKMFDFNENDAPKSMIEQQIREIVRSLIFIYSSGPGTPDWANTHDIYDRLTDRYALDYEKSGFSYKRIPKSVRACASYCGKPADICIYLKKV